MVEGRVGCTVKLKYIQSLQTGLSALNRREAAVSSGPSLYPFRAI